MQLLHVKLGALAHATPEDGAPQLMDFEHMLLRFLPRQSKHLLENHRDITHQVNRIIMDHDLPREIHCFSGASVLLDHRIFD